jgi:hypothetical protein
MPLTAWTIVEGASILLVVGAGFLGAKKYIDDRVSDALSKDEVIRKVSLLIKPDLIFDEDESILADRGADDFIKENGINISFGSYMDHRVPTVDSHIIPAQVLRLIQSFHI